MLRKLFSIKMAAVFIFLSISPLFAKIHLPCIYSQKEDQWKNEPLAGGKCGLTIGGYGCTITCLAMIYDYFAGSTGRNWADWNPKDLNNVLTSKGRYNSECKYIWPTINKSPPEGAPYCIYKGRWEVNNEGINKIKLIIRRELRRKNPVLAKVSGSFGEHFVVVMDYKKINKKWRFIIVDPYDLDSLNGKPWYLDEGKLGKYDLETIYLFKKKT